MKTISETKKKLSACKEKVDSIIQEAFCSLQQLIDQREKALLAENSEIAISKETRLSIQQETLQHLLESMSHCHSLAFNLLLLVSTLMFSCCLLPKHYRKELIDLNNSSLIPLLTSLRHPIYQSRITLIH